MKQYESPVFVAVNETIVEAILNASIVACAGGQ